MSTRSRLIVTLVVVVGIIGVLIHTAIAKASEFYVTVGELYSEGPQGLDSENTVNGNIVGASVRWNPSKSRLQFSMEDSKQGKQLPVVFYGDRPDDFANDWPVIVSGKMGPDGVFHADQLLIKCPSKYSAENAPQTFNAIS